jgi:hypothetical protein
VDAVRRILDSGVTQTGPKAVNISIPAGDPNNPEGDFGAELMTIGILGAGDLLPPAKGKKQSPRSEFDRIDARWAMLLEVLLREDRAKELAKTFTARTYFSFYQGLQSRKLVSTFVDHILQTTGLPETAEQRKARESSSELQAWVASWPER